MCKDSFEKMVDTLNLYGADNHEDIKLVFPFCQVMTFSPGDLLHVGNQEAKYVYFLSEGLVRVFSCTKNGNEFNKSFAQEGQFIAAIQSPIGATPSIYSIQALEEVVAIAINKKDLDKLYYRSLLWANIGRLYMETLAVRKEKREAQFLLDSAEDRYLQFVEDHPGLADRLPLYHIASYLGITDVALSRIRKRLSTRS